MPKPTPLKYLNKEQVAALFATIEAPRDRAIFMVAYHRGLRAGEVALLQMQDYRREAGRLYVHRLKCRSRDTSGEYLLTDIEQKALKAWLKVRGPAPGPLFPSRRKSAISQQMLDVLMKEYCAAAGLPRDLAHFHTLRHSCATTMMDHGEDIADVQDRLGHASIASTQIYAQVTNKRREAVDRRMQRGWV